MNIQFVLWILPFLRPLQFVAFWKKGSFAECVPRKISLACVDTIRREALKHLHQGTTLVSFPDKLSALRVQKIVWA